MCVCVCVYIESGYLCMVLYEISKYCILLLHTHLRPFNDMGLVDLESAYRDVDVVVAKPTTENGREDVVEPVVNVEWQNGDDKTPSEIQKDIKPNLKGDMLNVALLVLLYTLQGLPIGISLAIRTYMQNRKVSYVQQVCI